MDRVLKDFFYAALKITEDGEAGWSRIGEFIGHQKSTINDKIYKPAKIFILRLFDSEV